MANWLIHVADGQAALDYLYQQGGYRDPANCPRPGVMLLDLRLPDGLEVLKSIKSGPQLSSIPVVVLTTSKAEMDLVKAYEFHANSYLVKPMDFTQFSQRLETFGYYWLAWNQCPWWAGWGLQRKRDRPVMSKTAQVQCVIIKLNLSPFRVASSSRLGARADSRPVL